MYLSEDLSLVFDLTFFNLYFYEDGYLRMRNQVESLRTFFFVVVNRLPSFNEDDVDDGTDVTVFSSNHLVTHFSVEHDWRLLHRVTF